MTVIAELHSDDHIYLTTEWRHKEQVKTIPGSKWSTDHEQWRVPVSWTACLALRTTFGAELHVGPDLTNWAIKIWEDRIGPCTELREVDSYEGDPTLYWWQRSGAEFIARGKRVLITDDPGAGKAQPLSEPVLTPTGFVPMGEVTEGDLVIGSDGAPTRVWGVYRQGVRPVYRVEFSDGTYTMADENHLWRVQSKRDSKTENWQTLSTYDLLKRGVRLNGAHKWRIPLCSPIEFDQAEELPLDPWALGALLGDGTLHAKYIRFTTTDSELAHRMSEATKDLVVMSQTAGNLIDYSFTGLSVRKNALLDVLRSLGVSGKRSHEKFVPNVYLMSDAESRLALLQGLMDSDGYAGKNNHQVFTSVSEQLASDVAFLVRSLGGKATVRPKTSIPKGGNYLPWNVTIRMPKGVNPFSLERKAILVDTDPHMRLTKFISSIEYSHDEETQCIAVEAADRLYLTRDFIVTHNTITTIKGLQQLVVEGENPFPALFVCPSSMKKTWKRELEKWWPGLEVIVVKGTTAQRRKQLATPAHVYVMNFEALRSHSRLIPYGSTTLKKCAECGGEDPKVTVNACQTHEKELNKIEFQAVVADEIHKCKDGKSQQTRALKAATGDAPIRIGLTGTPISNDVTDLWSLLHWLEPTEYSAKTRWIDRYIETMLNLFGGMLVIGIKPSMEQEFYASINPRMRRMPEDVILNFLPPVIYERRDCEMAPKQAKAYKQAKEDFIIELESGTLPTGSAMVKMIRLLQFASSYAEVETIEEIDDDGFPKIKYKTTLTEPSAKLDAFMDDIDTFGTEQVAVMSVSRQLLELLSTRLTKKGIKHGMITGTTSEDDRNEAMENFQAGKIQFILFTSGAGGTGITLTAARYLCRLQVPFSLVDYKQSLRRVRRIGSERHENIIVIDYITEDTEDDHVFEVLDKKSMSFEDVVRDQDALLRMLKNEEK